MSIEKILDADAPLRTLNSDRLGREIFCKRVADILLSPSKKQCRVISLEGSWGEGKTSAIEMILDVLGSRDVDRRPFVARINAWQLGTKDSLVRGLLAELSSLTDRDRRIHKATKFVEAISDYEKALSVLKGGATSTIVVSLLQAGFKGVKWFSNKFGNLEARRARVEEEIANLNRPIIVVLDDLDRLLPDELVEVIRFVRVVGNFSNTTYLLAFDHDRVVELLTAGGVPSAASFLEKIVHLRQHLPPARTRDVLSILEDRLSDLDVFRNRRVLSQSAYRRYEIVDALIGPLTRDVRTLLRCLARLETLPSTISREIEFWDLFGLCFIAVKAPALFELIRRHPELFTEEVTTNPVIKDEENQKRSKILKAIESALSSLPGTDVDRVRGLMEVLFPSFAAMAFEDRSEEWSFAHGRVGNYKTLLSFLFAGFSEELPSDVVEGILLNTSRGQSISSFALDQEGLVRLADAIELRISKLEGVTIVDPDGLALAIVEKWLSVRSQDWADAAGMRAISTGVDEVVLALLAASQAPLATLAAVIEQDSDGLLSSNLIEEIIEGKHPQLSPLPNNSRWPEILRAHFENVRRLVKSSKPENFELLGAVLFGLSRISPQLFDDVVGEFISDSVSKRTLIRALGNSRKSSDVGRIAIWDDKLRSKLAALDALKAESKLVISEGGGDKPLMAASQSLISGNAIVVETGEKYRQWNER